MKNSTGKELYDSRQVNRRNGVTGCCKESSIGVKRGDKVV